MSVFEQTDFNDHESVNYFSDPETGLRAIIAVHSTALGPAAGGCRRWVYASEADALTDALRLSRGMTYKNAVAGLPFGGGKAVILARDHVQKSPELFAAFGRAVDSLDGRYITAEDVGVTVEDMQQVRSTTPYVSGLAQDNDTVGGDPSPWTALGVFLGICAAVETRLQTESLQGLRVAVQGVGNVGLHLCRMLHQAGAELVVADVNPENLKRARDMFPVTEVSVENILYSDVDVLAPCALGSVLTEATIPNIRAKVVAGAANNQLATESDGRLLMEKRILYAPDYVINAGGIISVAREYLVQGSHDQLHAEVSRIADRLRGIFVEADVTRLPTNEVADKLARRLVEQAGTGDVELSATERVYGPGVECLQVAT